MPQSFFMQVGNYEKDLRQPLTLPACFITSMQITRVAAATWIIKWLATGTPRKSGAQYRGKLEVYHATLRSLNAVWKYKPICWDWML